MTHKFWPIRNNSPKTLRESNWSIGKGKGCASAGIEGAGRIAFVFFVATLIWGPTGPYLATPFLILGLISWVKANPFILKRSPIFWLSILCVIYITVRATLGYFAAPSTLEEQTKRFADYLRIAGVWPLLIAPWLSTYWGQRHWNLAFGLSLLGFLCVAVPEVTSEDGRISAVAGPNGSAVVAGVLLWLTLVVGGAKLRRIVMRQKPFRSGIIGAVWLTVLGFLLFCFLYAQSRSAWIAWLLVVLLFASASTWMLLVSKQPRSRRYLGAVGVVILLLVTIAGGSLPMIQTRFAEVSGQIEALISSSESELDERGSVSYRVWVMEFGVNKWADKPLFGWSPGRVGPMIEQGEDERIAHLGHVHNMHLEILVGLGLTGFALFYGIVVLCFLEVVRATFSGRLPLSWGFFWLTASTFIGIEGFFDVVFFKYEPGALMSLLVAGGIACHFDRLAANARSVHVGEVG